MRKGQNTTMNSFRAGSINLRCLSYFDSAAWIAARILCSASALQ